MLSNSLSLPSFRYTVAQHRARPRYSNVIKYSLHNKAGHVAAIISADISISRILAGIQSFSSTASNLIVITYAPPPLPPASKIEYQIVWPRIYTEYHECSISENY